MDRRSGDGTQRGGQDIGDAEGVDPAGRLAVAHIGGDGPRVAACMEMEYRQARRLGTDSRQRREHREREQRSEEHTSELQSLMRISYAVFCLKKNKHDTTRHTEHNT